MILLIIANLLNRYLKLDPEMQGRLEKYNSKVIRATITTLDWNFFIKVHEQQLELTETEQTLIDAAFKASILALTKAALTDKVGISEEIEFHGDTTMLHEIINIFKAVEIDWEECLANYTGGIIAHGIGNITRNVKAVHEKLFETKKLNIKEYLQEEINLLVSPFAVEDFCNDVDKFRDAVERITAKITFLEKTFAE